jgi:hypothetical protein
MMLSLYVTVAVAALNIKRMVGFRSFFLMNLFRAFASLPEPTKLTTSGRSHETTREPMNEFS